MYELKEYSALVSIYKLSTYQDIKLDHPRMSPSGKEQPVGWMQPDLFLYEVVSLIISIS